MSKYFRKLLNWHARLWPKSLPKPPYNHVVQVGDPILRTKCECIPIATITSKQIKDIITKMKDAMKNHDCVGMAAPQIGINKRIFIMEMTKKHLKAFDEDTIDKREMVTFPLMVFINPTMKITDLKKVSFIEACESIIGYCAEVPRYKEVQIDGYSEEGKETSMTFRGWPARIAQHEMDHLDGVCYVDIMNKATFSCQFWKDINLFEGKIKLPFSPE